MQRKPLYLDYAAGEIKEFETDDVLSDVEINASGITGYPNNATKFLRGDGVWAVPPGGGGAVVGQATIPFATLLAEDRVTVVYEGILPADNILLTIAATNDDIYAQSWEPPFVHNFQEHAFDIVLRTATGTYTGAVKINYQIIPVS